MKLLHEAHRTNAWSGLAGNGLGATFTSDRVETFLRNLLSRPVRRRTQMLTVSSYWSLLGVLLSAFSTGFLTNDLKNRRTYLIVGGEDTSERKVVIRHDQSPLLFNIIVVGVAFSTAFTLVTCLVVLVSSVELTRLWEAMDSWQVVLAFIPIVLVLIYVLQSVSVRVFARWWGT